MFSRTDQVSHPPQYQTEWHSHEYGQITKIDVGVLIVDTAYGKWLVPHGRIGWIPPKQRHMSYSHTEISGHSTYLSPQYCQRMPAEPTVLKPTELADVVFTRLLNEEESSPIHSHLIAVLIHELSTSERETWQLPVPRDRRLQKLTMLILSDVSCGDSVADLAQVIGMGTRTLSRKFAQETGMPLVRWRILARLMKAMEWLQMGKSVEWVAQSCGYCNASVFIAVFKQYLACSPGQWIKK
ncbi:MULTISPECIES: helix-turn-helix transcriptional regulator [unclassified Vibrio]|uniref:AraC family transcriptional regulator n=1 Tax=unclassified Vibrio TaxID=2614977 RepID=UPI001482D261|nr:MULTISPECIES: helix-turn-helix transcriptional regulator [unclassified Vibrio]